MSERLHPSTERTPGPYYWEESEDSWELYAATTYRLPQQIVDALPEGSSVYAPAHPMKLIKAPKHGTPYAEYWPKPEDADFIVRAMNLHDRLMNLARDAAQPDVRKDPELWRSIWEEAKSIVEDTA